MAVESWPAETPLQVRLGVHAGGADEREGDYCGSSLNRAARVMSVARGGQVLVSRLTASLGGRLPGIELVDVGDRRLRRIELRPS